MKMDLNVGVGTIPNLATAPPFDCLNIDLFKLPDVDVVCDLAYLPFRNSVFRDAFAFHVLEHMQNPSRGLAELMRVTQRMVEVEVPFFLGSMAKHPRHAKGDVALAHSCSFHTGWFHKCLRGYKRCVRITYDFPFDLRIHVWAYPCMKIREMAA